MDREKARYLQNRDRVFKIYGINPDDRRYNCHHIIARHEAVELMGSDFDVNQLSNLIPMKIQDHEDLHKRMDFDDKMFDLQHTNNWEFRFRKPKKIKHH